MSIKEDNYQSILAIDGAHPSEDKYTEEQMKFFAELESYGIVELTVGFATQDDESRLRHVDAYKKNAEGVLTSLDKHANGWPDGLNDLESQLCDLLSDYNIESLITFKVGRKEIEEGASLYVTEPELKDDNGDEVSWNYWE